MVPHSGVNTVWKAALTHKPIAKKKQADAVEKRIVAVAFSEERMVNSFSGMAYTLIVRSAYTVRRTAPVSVSVDILVFLTPLDIRALLGFRLFAVGLR